MPVHRIPVVKRMEEREALAQYIKGGFLINMSEPTPRCSNELIRETPKKFSVHWPKPNSEQGNPTSKTPSAYTKWTASQTKCNEMLLSSWWQRRLLHIPLDEESAWVTTMHTSYSWYRWLRLPLGITSALEESQMRLTSALEGLDSIICIADDVLVFGEGTNFEKAQEDWPQQKIHCSNGTLSPKTDQTQHKQTAVQA